MRECRISAQAFQFISFWINSSVFLRMGITVLRFIRSSRHVGQIVMLRRMAGAPIRAESYFMAELVAGEVDEAFVRNRD